MDAAGTNVHKRESTFRLPQNGTKFQLHAQIAHSRHATIFHCVKAF